MKEVDEMVGNMEKAIGLQKEKAFPKGVVSGCTEIKDILGEISPKIDSEKDFKRLEKDVGGLIASLVANCEKGDQTGALGIMRQARDKVRFFRHYLSSKKDKI